MSNPSFGVPEDSYPLDLRSPQVRSNQTPESGRSTPQPATARGYTVHSLQPAAAYQPQPAAAPAYPTGPGSGTGNYLPQSSSSGYLPIGTTAPSLTPMTSGNSRYPTITSGTSRYPTITSGTSRYPTMTSGIPGYPTMTSGTPVYPTMTSGTPRYTTMTSGTPRYPTMTNGTPRYPTMTNGTPRYPTMTNGTPRYPTMTNGTPRYPTMTNGTPRYPTMPSGTPVYPTMTSGTPRYTTMTSGTPSYPGHSTYPSASSNPSQGHGTLQASSTLYMGTNIQGMPTIPFCNYDPSIDATVLRRALNIFGTDEAAIINVLTNRINNQKMKIIRSYLQAYGNCLVKDLSNRLSGDFLAVTMAMLTPTNVLLARGLYKAIHLLESKENTLVEILCCRTYAEIIEIKTAYKTMYTIPLQADLERDTSSHFRRLIVSMITWARDGHELNTSTQLTPRLLTPQLAPRLAQQLYVAGPGGVGVNETEFNRILSSYSYPVTRDVLHEYRMLKGQSLHEAIKSEFSGDAKNGLLAVCLSLENRPYFFATCLNDSIRDLHNDEEAFLRLLVTRAEVDLGTVKQEYHKMYSRTLEQDITDNASHDYCKMLLPLVGG